MTTKDAVWYLRKRYLVTFLSFCGIFCSFVLRYNLSVAIIELTSDTYITIGNQTHLQVAEFKWTSVEEGFVLSLFFYGYTLSPFTGLVTHKYGGATVFGVGTGITAVLSMLSPFLLRWNIYVFSVSRALEGIFEGFAFASFIDVFVHWAPPDERTRLIVYAHMGAEIGTAANYLICGFLTYEYGWEAMFFITGGCTLLWCLVWFTLVKNDPTSDKYITDVERLYLTKEITQISKTQVAVPWKKMLTSIPLWAYFNEIFSKSWILSFTMTSLPLYIKDVHGGDIKNIGLISSVPAWSGFLSGIPVPYLIDFIRSRKILSIPNVHRVCLAFGQVMTAAFLITTGLWMDFFGSIVTFSLIRICLIIASTSYQLLPVDVFPSYASTVRGLGVTGTSLGSLLSSTLMGYMVSNHRRSDWNSYFLLLSIFNVWSFLVYFKFGSGEPQSWATEQRTDTPEASQKEIENRNTTKITS